MFEIGTSLREARLRQGLDFDELERAHEGPGEVPARARGRAVRPCCPATRTSRASCASTRTPRARRPALRRRVQLALRRRRGGRRPLRSARAEPEPPPAARAARVAHRSRSRSPRSPLRHGARDRRLDASAATTTRRSRGSTPRRRASRPTPARRRRRAGDARRCARSRGASFMEVARGHGGGQAALHAARSSAGRSQRFDAQALWLAVDRPATSSSSSTGGTSCCRAAARLNGHAATTPSCA